jgi:hypothetical protein
MCGEGENEASDRIEIFRRVHPPPLPSRGFTSELAASRRRQRVNPPSCRQRVNPLLGEGVR